MKLSYECNVSVLFIKPSNFLTRIRCDFVILPQVMHIGQKALNPNIDKILYDNPKKYNGIRNSANDYFEIFSKDAKTLFTS